MIILTLVIVSLMSSLPPNYEDIESGVDQAVGEKVDITQADPQSNTIHIAHNNPKDRLNIWLHKRQKTDIKIIVLAILGWFRATLSTPPSISVLMLEVELRLVRTLCAPSEFHLHHANYISCINND